MKMKRIMLAAPKSGSGKTTITCALLQALMDRGESVISDRIILIRCFTAR